MVRCKFKVQSITLTASGTSISMCAVGNSEENKNFFKYTPNGTLNFTCVNPDAVKQLELEKEYYIDIHE